MTKQWQPLTDSQWAAISPFFDLKRKRKHDLRQIINCILWLLPTGCQWRNLPHGWPHWQAVYYYFDRWKADNLFERVNAALNELDRKQVDKMPTPSLVCIDSQSIKLSPMIGKERGLDPNKRVNGRKRQFIVDTEGRLWVAHVHAANEADGPAGCILVSSLLWRVGERLEKVMGDQAYNGVFAKELAHWSIDFEKASRPESAQGFVPIAKRWVVERTIGWTNFFRRIVKDYEYTLSSSVSWLYLANIQIMLQRIGLLDQR
ncbi:IS5 family transposase [Spirosoma taeanense]|uniref:IS5 family transposase n=1 Tax=Spirosoma taeanense TaxID=2735870 RepID=A0A6M5YA35_9BACT|nr:IS5 family transposase [Spirosoma taeanense]QJW90825.1 IS5 family transposase [Spirosoma taeanense]